MARCRHSITPKRQKRLGETKQCRASFVITFLVIWQHGSIIAYHFRHCESTSQPLVLLLLLQKCRWRCLLAIASNRLWAKPCEKGFGYSFKPLVRNFPLPSAPMDATLWSIGVGCRHCHMDRLMPATLT